MKRLKTLRSYAAHHRFLGECGGTSRWFNNRHAPAIARYCFSSTRLALPHNGHWVWIVETAHRVYEVWKIDDAVLRRTEDEAFADKGNLCH